MGYNYGASLLSSVQKLHSVLFKSQFNVNMFVFLFSAHKHSKSDYPRSYGWVFWAPSLCISELADYVSNSLSCSSMELRCFLLCLKSGHSTPEKGVLSCSKDYYKRLMSFVLSLLKITRSPTNSGLWLDFLGFFSIYTRTGRFCFKDIEQRQMELRCWLSLLKILIVSIHGAYSALFCLIQKLKTGFVCLLFSFLLEELEICCAVGPWLGFLSVLSLYIQTGWITS